MESNADTSRDIVEWLNEFVDLFKYYLQSSLPLWAENKKLASEVSRLKVRQNGEGRGE